MNALQRSVILMTCCLFLIFGLSIALSWWNYGTLDLPTVGIMAAMLLPLVGAAAAVVLWAGRRIEVKPTKTVHLSRRELEEARR